MALIMKPKGSLVKSPIVRGNETAIPRIDGFIDIQGESTDVSNRTQHPSPVAPPEALAGILKDRKIVMPSDLRDPVHVAGVPEHMDGHDHPGSFGYLPFHIIRIHGQGFINLGKNGSASENNHRRDRSDEGITRDKNLIPRAHSEGNQ